MYRLKKRNMAILNLVFSLFVKLCPCMLWYKYEKCKNMFFTDEKIIVFYAFFSSYDNTFNDFLKNKFKSKLALLNLVF